MEADAGPAPSLQLCAPPQILLFGLLFGLLAPGWSLRSNRCLPEQDLEEAAERELRSFQGPPQNFQGLPQNQPPGSSYSCPVEMFTQQPPTHLKDRSLSPWGYVRETMENHFPSTYTRAQCLCTGCVLIQNSMLVESHDYNSAHVVQSMVFLKKELCRDKEKYRLKPEDKSSVNCKDLRQCRKQRENKLKRAKGLRQRRLLA
ncbi:Interleukin-17C [Dissostichus eleginoides]|uniref:Interleukin-17C n=1 Tax=Dissostichus eleginoides TaxID=100907 RepID=A0AAD9BUG4_DISEL|nr:Interleukin-17C [Dissostichus eleginoides]